jgi:hypothetical protein
MGYHSPANINGLEKAALQAHHAKRVGVNPDPAFESGQRLGFKVWRRPLRVGFEVEDYQCRLPRSLIGQLRLTWGVAPLHGIRHQQNELDAHASVVLLPAGVAGEIGWRAGKAIESLSLCGVLFRGKWLPVALNEACDAPVRRLNQIAHLVPLLVNLVQPIAQVGVWMLDHENFVLSAIHSPRARRLGEQIGCGNILGSSSPSRWTGRSKYRGNACEAGPNSCAATPDSPWQIASCPGFGLTG